MAIEGGCHCGAVRYAIRLERLDDVANCHCTDCRRLSGAPFATWATVPLGSFAWLDGTPAVYESLPGCRRWSCPVCGSRLALHTALAPDTLDIAVCTLDRPDAYPPSRNIWVRSRLPWVADAGVLPDEYEEVL
jgi:hypothetical protein